MDLRRKATANFGNSVPSGRICPTEHLLPRLELQVSQSYHCLIQLSLQILSVCGNIIGTPLLWQFLFLKALRRRSILIFRGEGHRCGVQLDVAPWQLKVSHSWCVSQKPIKRCRGDPFDSSAHRMTPHPLELHFQATLKM